MANETQVKVWNATTRNLLVGADGVLLRPAESMWVNSGDAEIHVKSGALAIIEIAQTVENSPVEAQPKKSRKKAEQEQVEETVPQETSALVDDQEDAQQPELNVSDNNENSTEDVPENSQ